MADASRISPRDRWTPSRPLLSDPAYARSGPADRLLRAHKIVEQAAIELHDAGKESGVKALVFAASTHLALTLGAAEAGAFLNMVASVARQGRRPSFEPEPVADCGDGLFLRNGRECEPRRSEEGDA